MYLDNETNKIRFNFEANQVMARAYANGVIPPGTPIRFYISEYVNARQQGESPTVPQICHHCDGSGKLRTKKLVQRKK